MKYIEFKSLSGQQFTLWINDGSAEDTSLIGGVNPFSISVDSENNIFRPVRFQTGNIEIVADSVDLSAIIGQDPLSRPVSLVKVGELYPVWKGYLQTQAFTQIWDKGPNTISIPVISALGALCSRYPSNAVSDVKYISFAQFIINMILVNNSPDFRYFVFPQYSEPLTTLTYNFNLLNYATWNEDTREYDMQSYEDILSDICKMFGWCAVEQGETLVFTTPDKTGDYYRLSYTDLDLLANGQTYTYDTLTQDEVSLTIFGTDHNMTFVPGRRSVKVVGRINNSDMTIYSMDFDKEFQGSHSVRSMSVSDGVKEYTAVNFNKETDSIIQPLDSNTNIKQQDFDSSSARHQGCCISRERIYVHDGRTGSQAIIQDSGWNDRIIFRFGYLSEGTTLFTIAPPNRYFYNSLNSGMYLFLSGSMKQALNAEDDWENFNGSILLEISVGNMVTTQLIRVKDGNFSGGRVGTSFGNQTGGFNFPMIADEGQLTIKLLVPSSSDLNVCGMTTGMYYCIENLKLSLSDKYWAPTEYDVPNENKERIKIGKGFQEDEEITFNLSTRRRQTSAPSSRSQYPKLNWAQYGTGLLLTDGSTGGVPATLYDSKTPELALAERMEDYYTRSRQQLEVEVRGTELLQPWMLYDVGVEGTFLLIAQSIDWRDERIKALLIDVS